MEGIKKNKTAYPTTTAESKTTRIVRSGRTTFCPRPRFLPLPAQADRVRRARFADMHASRLDALIVLPSAHDAPRDILKNIRDARTCFSRREEEFRAARRRGRKRCGVGVTGVWVAVLERGS
jgi:hypothetical protein